MRLLIICLLLLSTTCFAVPYQVPAESGFRILRPGAANGVGIPATAAANRDPNYPYWGSYCGEAGNVLCWPEAPRSEFVVPAGTKKVTVSLYSDSGYGSAQVFHDGTAYNMAMHAYSTVSGRRYRLQTYADMTMSASTCDHGGSAAPISPRPYEAGAVRVYRLSNSPRFSTCTITFDNLDLASDTRISVSFNGLFFRYDNNIYDRLPSGTDVFVMNPFLDRVTYNFFDAADNSSGSGELFDSIIVSGWINLDGYLDFSLVSAPVQSITVGPQEQKVRYAYFDTKLKSNLPKVNATIRCQYVFNGSCALSDGDLMIPMLAGIRADRIHGANYTAALSPNLPLHLTSDLGFSFNEEMYLGFMFGIDPAYLRANPATFGKTFRGDVTLIVEADFR